MSGYLKKIHEAIGGDYTDDSQWVEEAACELARRVDWFNNWREYKEAAKRLIPELEKIEGTEEIRDDIKNKINNQRPFNIKAIEEIVRAGKIVD